MINDKSTNFFLAVVWIPVVLLLCLGSFMAGVEYAIQKHEDTYCPDPFAANVPTGCRNGEGWDK